MRMKYVYPTRQIAHLWVHQTQSSARNAGGNFYFREDTIYSYRDSFPIGRIVKHKGKTVYLIRDNTYSVTTPGHISDMRRAIPGDAIRFAVYDPSQDIKHQWVVFITNVKMARQRFENETRKIQRLIAYSAFLSACNAAQQFAEFFGYAFKAVCRLPKDHLELVKAIGERNEKQRLRREENDRKRSERFFARREECLRENAKTAADVIADWRAGGAYSYRLNSVPTMLRIRGELIETSRGVEFPIVHAMRVLPIVERILASGERWQANGHQIRLGHYAIDRIEENGTLYAGCHVVAKEELLRLIAELKEYSPVLPELA